MWRMIFFTVFFFLFEKQISAEYKTFQDTGKYTFIRYNDNRIRFVSDVPVQYEKLKEKVRNVCRMNSDTVHFLHIGDSHIQADYLTGQVRQELIPALGCNYNGRGFIFPYNMAESNNPENYHFRSSGTWDYEKSTKAGNNGIMGLSGFSVFTKDSAVSIQLVLKDKAEPKHSFDHLWIFYSTSDSSRWNNWELKIPGMASHSAREQIGELRVMGFRSAEFLDSVSIFIRRSSTQNDTFFLHGFYLTGTQPGMIYSAVGTNGASTESLLRCKLLIPQLKWLNPDAVILSLGANDAHNNNFDKEKFRFSYDSVICMVKRSLPGAVIFLTTPGDACYRDHKHNPRIEKVREVILEMAEKHSCALWDMNQVMGGSNSILHWYKQGLARKDRIHFSKDGYYLLGNLMTQAWIDFFRL